VQFLSIAKGSVGELKDELYTALDEGYLSPSEFYATYAIADDTTRLIGGLMGYLRRSERTGSKFKRAIP